MNYFTATISVPLAEKLKEKGMPLEYKFAIRCLFMSLDKMKPICPTYGKVFDWLLSDKKLAVCMDINPDKNGDVWGTYISFDDRYIQLQVEPTWHEAAEAAIEKALTLI